MSNEKLIRSHYDTADRFLDKGPGVVHWITLVGATDTGTVYIRDGQDTGGEILWRAECHEDWSLHLCFNPPLIYDRGLFVDIDTNITAYTIGFSPRGG